MVRTNRRCGDLYSLFAALQAAERFNALDCPCARLISEPIPTRRIGPYGAHRQQKVDRSSNRTSGRAHRRWLVRRKCRGCTETLNNGCSSQGAKSRQTFSDSRLASMIPTLKRAIDRTMRGICSADFFLRYEG